MIFSPFSRRAIRSLPSTRREERLQDRREDWRGLEPLEPRLLLSATGSGFDFSAVSWLGGTGNDEEVRGAVIQSDGTVVLAANIGNAQPGGLTPSLLGNANVNSSGAIIRLTPDGQDVLSVTRVAGKVLDLSSDASGNLYVAMWTEGFAKLNADADAILWAKSTIDLGFANVQRIDSGPDGYVAVLGGGSLDAGTTLGNNVSVFDPDGIYLGGVGDGKWKNDVVIHEPSETVIFLGYRNATDGASGLPVQISYYRGIAYDGSVKYTGYDWSGSPSSPDYLNSPTNNMADTRGYRATIGDDGYLYLSFESAGGNNLFRYDPFDINTPVSLSGGDQFHSPFNTGANHIMFFGKYEPATGAFVDGNHFLTRLSDGGGNTVFVRGGEIRADADGRVYLAGRSAWGLPLPSHPAYSGSAGFNPGVDNNYLGGSFLLVMDSDLTTRLHISTLTGGAAHALAVRSLDTGGSQIAFGGRASNELYMLDGIQMQPGGGHDGFFAVIENSAATPGNTPPTASFTSTLIDMNLSEITLRFDASGSTDVDGDSLRYLWHFGDGARAEGLVVDHTFALGANRTVTLTVLDGEGGWAHDRYTVGTPNAAFAVSSFYGDAPITVDFNASATTHLSEDAAAMAYMWDFGDGNTGFGIRPWHTYTEAGVYQVILTVTDSLGLQSSTSRTIVVGDPGAWTLRLDFQNFGQPPTTTAPGFVPAYLEEYSPERGFGYLYVDPEFRYQSRSDHFTDLMLRDAHLSGTSYQVSIPATYLVDVPNGTYRVVAYLNAQRHTYTFLGIAAEGQTMDKFRQVNSSSYYASIFEVVVSDGQLTLDLAAQSGANSLGRWEWAGLEVHQLSAAEDQAPMLTRTPGGPQLMTGSAQALAPNLLLVDDAASLIQGATARIIDGYLSSEDVLMVSTIGNITAQWDARTGTLQLTGEDTVGNYQAVLRSVQYNNVAASISGGERIISFEVQDQLHTSTPVSVFLLPAHLATITVVEDFESYNAGDPLNGSGFWTSAGSAAIVDDPSGLPNLAGRVINRTTQSSNNDPGFLIDAGEQATLFFRAYFGPTTGSGGMFGMGVAGTNQVAAGVFLGTTNVAVGTASNSVRHAPEAEGWYRIWIEIDNNLNRYSVYLQSDDDGYYAERTHIGTRNFHQSVTGALDTFYVRYANHPSQHWVTLDDITMIRPVGVVQPAQPFVEVKATRATALEGDPDSTAVFTLVRSGNLDTDLTVYYTIDSSTASSNYELLTDTPGVLVIPAGNPFATLTVRAVDNDVADGLRWVRLSVDADASYNIGPASSAKIGLVDDETPATVTVTATTPNAYEEGEVPGAFTFHRTGPTTYDLEVSYILRGDAVLGVDYTISEPTAGTIVIPAGQSSAVLAIMPINDTEEEGFEWVIVEVDRGGPDYVAGSLSQARVVIHDNDLPIQYRMIDDFENYFDQMQIRDSLTWVGDTNARVFSDPLLPDNLVLYSRDRTQRSGNIDDVIWLGQGQTATVFFRMFVQSATTQRTWVGLHGDGYTRTTNAGVEVNAAGIEGQPYQLQTWYNVWLVVDYTTNQYQVYLQSDDDPMYEDQQLIAANRNFRSSNDWQSPMPLNMFNISHTNHPQFTDVFVDDIFFTIGDGTGVQPVTVVYGIPTVNEVIRNDGQNIPNALNTLDIVFNVDVAGVEWDVLTLINQTEDEVVDLSGVAFSYDPVSFKASWDLAALGLGAGYYAIELDASRISNSAKGLLLDGDGDGQPGGNFVMEGIMVALMGDADLNGEVTDADLAVVQSNLGQSDVGFGGGDFTGDGRVTLYDAYLLFRNFGQTIQPLEVESTAVESLAAATASVETQPVAEPAELEPVTPFAEAEPAPVSSPKTLPLTMPASVTSPTPELLTAGASIEAQAAWQPGGLSAGNGTLLALWDDFDDEDQ